MKKRLIYSCLLAGATFIAGCTKNFDAINTDPTKVNAAVFPPNFLLAQAQIKFSNSGYDQLLFQSMWSQSWPLPMITMVTVINTFTQVAAVVT
jgi:PBP1b-binding outer membrane lipoprotein LpoB